MSSRAPSRCSTRDLIFAKARKLFNEKGYHATSLNQIAKAVGIKKSSLYNYISGKQQLLEEILVASIDEAIIQQKQILTSTMAPVDKLRTAIKESILRTTKDIELRSLFFLEHRALNPKACKRYIAARDAYEHIIRGIIEEGIKSADFRKVDVKMATFALLGMCNWLVFWYKPKGRISAEAIAEIFTETGVRALINGKPMSRRRE